MISHAVAREGRVAFLVEETRAGSTLSLPMHNVAFRCDTETCTHVHAQTCSIACSIDTWAMSNHFRSLLCHLYMPSIDILQPLERPRNYLLGPTSTIRYIKASTRVRQQDLSLHHPALAEHICKRHTSPFVHLSLHFQGMQQATETLNSSPDTQDRTCQEWDRIAQQAPNPDTVTE